MNLEKARDIINFYKKNFHDISGKEIYKWRAVKTFQTFWNPDADDFGRMLENSLALAYNLLDSGQYYPKRMLTQYTEMDSQSVKQLLADLYNEETEDFDEKFAAFRAHIKKLNEAFFSIGTPKKSYQDHRAFMVYLSLRYPDKYFFYKFEEFKIFAEKVEAAYKPKRGAIENLYFYTRLCERLRDEILKDKELLELHRQRLTEKEYFDDSYNILTQDIIYSAVVHFPSYETRIAQIPAAVKLQKVDEPLFPAVNKQRTGRSPRKVDYVKKQIQSQILGELGEELVVKYEQEKLAARRSKKKVEWISVKDDSKGYDIKSYDENGNEIFIEVKATTGRCEREFFITFRELETSLALKEKYYLYRVYDLNIENQTAKFREYQGSLENFCTNPVIFIAKVAET